MDRAADRDLAEQAFRVVQPPERADVVPIFPPSVARLIPSPAVPRCADLRQLCETAVASTKSVETPTGLS